MARADAPALRKGLGYYEQAVALDPNFAEAWARVSTCKALLFTNSVADPALASGAKGAARESIELAPDKPDGEMALGTYYRVVEGNQTLALEAYRKAEKLAPGTPDPLRSIGRAEMPMGRWQDAIGHYDEAERLDPKNAINVGNSAQPLAYLRRCGEARQAVDRTLALAPDNLSRISQKLDFLLCERRRRAARALVADTARRIGPAETAAYLQRGTGVAARRRDFALLRRLTPAAFDDEEAVLGERPGLGRLARRRHGRRPRLRGEGHPVLRSARAELARVPGPARVLGPLLAFAGKKAEAIREAVRATELDPVATSPWSGADALAQRSRRRT